MSILELHTLGLHAQNALPFLAGNCAENPIHRVPISRGGGVRISTDKVGKLQKIALTDVNRCYSNRFSALVDVNEEVSGKKRAEELYT